jgi:4-amino-4-deoxy-L-arabinose transferase-like glycosyltransferase
VSIETARVRTVLMGVHGLLVVAATGGAVLTGAPTAWLAAACLGLNGAAIAVAGRNPDEDDDYRDEI